MKFLTLSGTFCLVVQRLIENGVEILKTCNVSKLKTVLRVNKFFCRKTGVPFCNLRLSINFSCSLLQKNRCNAAIVRIISRHAKLN